MVSSGLFEGIRIWIGSGGPSIGNLPEGNIDNRSVQGGFVRRDSKADSGGSYPSKAKAVFAF